MHILEFDIYSPNCPPGGCANLSFLHQNVGVALALHSCQQLAIINLFNPINLSEKWHLILICLFVIISEVINILTMNSGHLYVSFYQVLLQAFYSFSMRFVAF